MERGRSKAYRPLPTEVRTAAVERGLAAYGRGAWYLAHEELEPAWMGTDDPVERAVLSGLIKLAAAYVHAARGNVLGVRTNLRGARERLRTAAASAGAAEGAPGAAGWVDLDVLLDDLEDRLARVQGLCAAAPGREPGSARDSSAGIATAVPPSHDVAGPSGRFRGAPVAVAPLPLPRRPG
jgi:predicted metal-dependent hydrolase